MMAMGTVTCSGHVKSWGHRGSIMIPQCDCRASLQIVTLCFFVLCLLPLLRLSSNIDHNSGLEFNPHDFFKYHFSFKISYMYSDYSHPYSILFLFIPVNTTSTQHIPSQFTVLLSTELNKGVCVTIDLQLFKASWWTHLWVHNRIQWPSFSQNRSVRLFSLEICQH